MKWIIWRMTSFSKNQPSALFRSRFLRLLNIYILAFDEFCDFLSIRSLSNHFTFESNWLVILNSGLEVKSDL